MASPGVLSTLEDQLATLAKKLIISQSKNKSHKFLVSSLGLVTILANDRFDFRRSLVSDICSWLVFP